MCAKLLCWRPEVCYSKGGFYRHRGIGNESNRSVAHLVRMRGIFLVTHRPCPRGCRKFGFREKPAWRWSCFSQLACIVHIISKIRHLTRNRQKRTVKGSGNLISKDKAKEDKYPIEKTDIGGQKIRICPKLFSRIEEDINV